MEKLGEKEGKRIACGFLLGGANGLFGGGGGMLAVPLLCAVGLPQKKAHATAILAVLPVSLFSFFLYLFYGYFDASVLIPTALGVSVGGLLGAKLLALFDEKKVFTVFALLQLFAGFWLFFS